MPSTSIPKPSREGRAGTTAARLPSLVANTQSPTVAEAEQKPWKYIGYKGYAEVIASEEDFFILRRFKAASVRVALSLQDQVAVLEEKLAALDERYSQRECEDLHNGTFRQDEKDRADAIENLRQKLVQYNEFALQQAALRKYPDTLSHAPQDIKSLENWHYNHDFKAIAPEEQKYLQYYRDLFSVVPKEKTPLRKLLEKSRQFHVFWLWRDKEAPNLPIYDAGSITYNSDQRINQVMTTLIMVAGLIMIIAPIWILEYLTTDEQKLGTITAFIVTFVAILSTVTVSRPFEILGATAALVIAAVVVAYLLTYRQVFCSVGGIPTTWAQANSRLIMSAIGI